MKRWYVVQVFAGYESLVKEDLLRRVEEQGLEDLIGQVLIPSAKQQQLFAVDQEKDQQLFPGYVLVEMEAVPEAMRLVLLNPRVMKFLGGKDPQPLSKKEIERVLSQVSGKIAVEPKRDQFEVGKEVEIKEGPFAGFVGMIEKVDQANEKIVVMVSIFGRMTPVELGYHQIKQ